ncbi:MAG: hypothetical protein INQ03_02390 [Candidatus Heimdallarchaeota archaeon]|nr:hypothetical protein [Candidatus Heimdallarchaeota archaeon]
MVNSVCANCNTPIFDVAKVITQGCSKCGGTKIIKNRGDGYRDEDPLMKNKGLDKDISIYVKGKGEYVLNLEALAKTDKDEPMMVEDQKGRQHLIFNSDL